MSKGKLSLTDKLTVAIMILFRVVFLVASIVTASTGNWETAAISLVGLILSFSPQFIERTLRVDLPITYELIIILFIFATMFMGEVGDAYDRFWWWDLVLHASSGVLLGYVGFLVLYILKRQDKLQTSPFVIAFFAFCVGMTSAVIWEIFEFSVDQTLGTNMQKGLGDTMTDSMVAALGSLLAAIAAYIHVSWPKRSFMRIWVNDYFRHNPIKSKRKNKLK